MNYYNDNDSFICQWLRELIKANLIGEGEVDERSIHDIKPGDLDRYRRCHFFAGIAGWELALQLAGFPAEIPVWTGSCPCQPFSAAGKRQGADDDRNLWPAWFNLIRVCRPPIIFGEQVEAAIRLRWLDRVFDDLEAEGYTCGAVVLPACSVGAPHIRQRLWWYGRLANSEGSGQLKRIMGKQAEAECEALSGRSQSDEGCWRHDTADGCESNQGSYGASLARFFESKRLADTEEYRFTARLRGSECGCTDGGVGNAEYNGLQIHGQGRNLQCQQPFRIRGKIDAWSDSQWIYCKDGKYRRIPSESALFPLAQRLPGRVGTLRGSGNSIVSQVAAEFIKAVMDKSGAEMK